MIKSYNKAMKAHGYSNRQIVIMWIKVICYPVIFLWLALMGLFWNKR